MEFAKAKDAELGWVDGVIHMNKDDNSGEVFPVLATLPQVQVRTVVCVGRKGKYYIPEHF